MQTAVRWPEYMDAKTIQEYCGLSRASTWRLIKSGELEAVKVGRLVKVCRSSLDAYLARNAYAESKK